MLKSKERISSWTRPYKTTNRPCSLQMRNTTPLVSLAPHFFGGYSCRGICYSTTLAPKTIYTVANIDPELPAIHLTYGARLFQSQGRRQNRHVPVQSLLALSVPTAPAPSRQQVPASLYAQAASPPPQALVGPRWSKDPEPVCGE